MKFDHPNILFFLWGLVPLAGVLVYGILRHKKILARYARETMFDHILPGFSYGPKWVKAVLAVLAAGFAVAALAGPVAGYRWEKTTRQGVDIMIALDCSRSMLAQDVPPTRLTRAKREIIDLTRLMHSDRAGLVAFSGAAVLQCPLTLDYNAFGIFLDALTPDYLPVGGTDLTAALETCYNGFDPSSTTGKAIILITDGEDTARGEDALIKTVQKFAKEKIRIFAIGVGDPAGAPIPAKGGGFKKDAAGNIILSKVDEAMLKKICAMTQGRYVRSVAGDMDLEQIYSGDILGTMERKELTAGRKKVWEKRFQWALLPCVLLLIAELLYPQGGKKSSHSGGRRSLICLAAGLCLTGMFSLTPAPARAGIWTNSVKEGITAWKNGQYQQAKNHFIEAQLENPDDPRLYYNIGAAAYKLDEYDLAESNFAQAVNSKDKELRHNALYNLANTRYKLNKLEQAMDDYQDLLKEFPDDPDAKANLEIVKKKLEEKKKQQEQASQDQNNQNQDDQNQDKPNKDQGDQNRQAENPKDQNQNAQGSQGQKGQSPEQNQGPDHKQGSKDQGHNSDPQNVKKDSQTPDQPPADQAQAGQSEKNKAQKDQGQEGGKKDAQAGRAGQMGQGETGMQQAQCQMLENRLNRLEDKPGMALIPQTGARHNDKDW